VRLGAAAASTLCLACVSAALKRGRGNDTSPSLTIANYRLVETEELREAARDWCGADPEQRCKEIEDDFAQQDCG
jgi:hypothetical protein